MPPQSSQTTEPEISTTPSVTATAKLWGRSEALVKADSTCALMFASIAKSDSDILLGTDTGAELD